MSTGEVMLDANQELTPTMMTKLIEAGIDSFEVFFPERDEVGTVISATLRKDPVKSRKDALIEIYRKLRPGRSADGRYRHPAFRRHVLRCAQV